MTQHFLIVQLADIGDLILTTPALSALRERYPDAHITLLASAHAAPALRHTTLVDEIITFDKGQMDGSRALLRPANLRRILALRRGRYEAVVFLHHFTLKLGTFKFALIAFASGARRRIGLDNGSGWFLTERVPDKGFGAVHQALYWLQVVGLLGAPTQPRPAHIGISDAERAWAQQTLVESPESVRIALHAGSGGYSPARRWDAHKFAALADTLQARFDAQVLLVGGVGDDIPAVKAAMQTRARDFSGQTTLGQLAALIEGCDLFIGADSGVLHIAAATGTPVVALFGPSNHQAWGPWTPGSASALVRSAPSCSPCSYVAHTVGQRQGCAARTCMRMIEAGEVLHAAQRLLQGDPTVGSRPAVFRPQPQFERRVRILGLPVDALTYAQWLDLIAGWVQDSAPRPPRHVCTINPEFIMIAQNDVNFYNILSRADLNVPDGVGLLWAAKRLRQPLPERVTGSDGLPLIAARAAQIGWRLFLLGAAPGVAEKAAAALQKQYSGLQIAGTFGGSPAPEEEDSIVERVNASGAHILLVAYGAPEQDKWIARNLPRLQVKMAMGVGGALDFVAGIVPRAPLWMRKLGLEWLYRLYLQPRRIGRMMRLPRFVGAVLWRGARGPAAMEGNYG
ncbi:MAG: WecB/TagA/CpsF family glycosyltransferase [Chloroflexi bacterium]|nr:WecB/TagA/CpsF family glycosyltransferase [Chloroflexota bacterium]